MYERGGIRLAELATSVDAEDRGSGLAETVAIVDGSPQTPVQNAVGSCKVPFVEFRPCPQRQTMGVVLDTTSLSDGPHTISFGVRDAAGNETRTEPVDIIVHNAVDAGVANGLQATRFVKLSAWFNGKARVARRVAGFGTSALVSGRLTSADGTPIAGASIDVTRKVDRPNSAAKSLGHVVTSADGTFRYKLAAGSSRLVTLSYRAFSLDPAPVASTDLTLVVRAGVTLDVAPRNVRNGTRVTFRGRLRGGRDGSAP